MVALDHSDTKSSLRCQGAGQNVVREAMERNHERRANRK
jgi:predicted GNAT family acetyltransferase